MGAGLADTEEMKAVPLPFFKTRLMEVARELYLEHGWTMPRGLEGFAPDPLNYKLPEHKQAQRAKKDPQELKALFQTCWSQSDSGAGFRAALLEQGFALAQGDRRGLVAVDHDEEVYSLSRWCGVKSKDLSKRLGEPTHHPNVDEAREALTARQSEQQAVQERERRQALESRMAALNKAKAHMIESHRAARERLLHQQKERQEKEARERSARFAKGFKGIWQWVSGTRAKIRRQNELEVSAARIRNRQEKHQLSQSQLRERRSFNAHYQRQRLQIESEWTREGPEQMPRRGHDPTGPTFH